MSTLPRFVVFYHYGVPMLPLICSSADDGKKGYIMRCESSLQVLPCYLPEDYVPPPPPEEMLRKPDAKFELVPATSTGGGLVHIKSCLNNKYLRVQSDSSRWIVAAADEPEEDQSKWCCTLFKPELGYGSLNFFNFNDLQVNFFKPLNDDEIFGDAAWQLNEPGDSSCNSLLKFTDWETLVFLPRRVIFKGDNDKYLLAGDDDELIFSGSDPADELAGHQIFSYGDGSVSIRSDKTGKDWSVPFDDGRIVADGTGYLYGYNMFRPVKMDGSNVIALRGGGRDIYLCRGTSDDYLNCGVDTIVDEAKFIVEEIKEDT